MPDILEIELRISEGNSEVVLGNARKNLEDFVKETTDKSPTLKFKVAGESFIDLDKLEKRAEITRLTFAEIAKTRLDNGQVGNLTKEIVFAAENARRLDVQIRSIKKELANPTRTSSIESLTKDLRLAEKEAAVLEKRIVSLSARGAGGERLLKGQSLKLSGFQKTNLSYQVNDVVTGLASGQNPSQILAQQGGQITQIFSKEQIAGFAASYGGLVSILGAGAIAIAATYKITGDLRAEAERRLKVEELIVGTVNRQILGQKQALKDFKELVEEQARARAFSRDLQTDSIEQLRQRKATAEQLLALTAKTLPVIENGKVVEKPNENFQKLSQQILDFNKQIEEIPYQKNALAAKTFDEHFESFQKNQEKNRQYLIEAEKRNAQFEKDVEKAQQKVKELEKGYTETFNNLLLKSGSNNPFVSVFSEADKSLKELKENIKGLPPELQAVAIKIQQQFNLRKLLEAGIDNKLSVFDLRNEASNFKNPFDGEKQKKDQEEFISRFLRNNPNYLYLNNKTQLDDDEKQKILKRFAPSSLLETPADRLNKNLDEKFNLLYKPGQTADQLALTDKRFISATAGANPLDLTKDLREKAALVREREAVRQERYQQDALQLYRDQREYQKQIAENTKRQNEIGARGGTKALELTLKDETSSGNAQLQSAPTARDTSAAYFDPDFDSLNNRGTLTNRR